MPHMHFSLNYALKIRFYVILKDYLVQYIVFVKITMSVVRIFFCSRWVSDSAKAHIVIHIEFVVSSAP
jgi:hypothetical protein